MMSERILSEDVKRISRMVGFDLCTIAKARRLDEYEDSLRDWLQKGFHGSMSYMERNFEMRLDPSMIVPGAKSICVFSLNYHNAYKTDPSARVSQYAFGRDYHKTIRAMLKKLTKALQELQGDFNSRYFVDSGPVMERQWAQISGHGWLGKHTLLLHPRKGSYFFLAVLILDVELSPDETMRDYCGTCTRCIDACPTDAIDSKGYTLNASRCISYLTIEHKGSIPEEFKGNMEHWIYGCDICQEVCPWNRFSKPNDQSDFQIRDVLVDLPLEKWQSMDKESFEQGFKGSPLMRAGFENMKRNAEFLSS